ncbi:MAG: translation initiation factor IF-2 [Candidatus Nealsonbacteria bacterium]
MTKTVLNFKRLNFGFVSDLDIRISDFYSLIMVKKKDQNLITRPPVVVVLGHVDHGKSTLLCAIKDFKITEKEAGGITQHIGAYEIEHQGKSITFIDTPGHEAFSAMRSRGAKVADIAILVVAADEGVKTQTKEALSHIKKSGLPLIVAINKIDKPTADPEKVRRELSRENILVESMGGKVPSVEVSAKTGQGIEDLLELILLVAEMEQLKGDIVMPAEGVVIEAYLDSQRGPTATLLLDNGILRPRDIIGTDSCFGKVKNLENFQEIAIKEASPSMPVVVFGFENVPKVGEEFRVFSDIELAKNHLQKPEKKVSPVFSLEPDQRVLNLILKADVLGSLEAIEEVLKELPQEKVVLRILKSEVGEINESDIKLAKGSKAQVLAFRVKTNPIAQLLAEREKIKIIGFEVIYELVEGVRKIMEKIIKPEVVRIDFGKVKISAIFRTEKNRQILGGKVIEGEIKKGALVEIFRLQPAHRVLPPSAGPGEEKVGQGRIINLQRDKKDAERVKKGEKCGVLYEGDVKIEEDDVLMIYTEERKKGEL